MEAIFEFKGKQFRAKPGDVLQVPYMGNEEKAEISTVMYITDGKNVKIGTPYVENARVILEKIEDKKGKKIIVFKFKRRKNYKRMKGHRQLYSIVKVVDIIA